MVFKVFIQYLIDKYLKNYIERFDYEKVKLSLKSGLCSWIFSAHYSFIFSLPGNIVLENLRLKPEALVSRMKIETNCFFFY